MAILTGKQIRRFGGKKYQWISSRRHKSQAKSYARMVREEFGFNVRVIKGKDYRGRTIYRIYESVARRKKYRGW